MPPSSAAVQQASPTAAPAEADPTSATLPTATLSLELSPPSKEAVKLRDSPGATAEGWAAAGSPTVFSGAATVDEAAQAGECLTVPAASQYSSST